MSNETEQTEKTSEDKVARSGGLDFGAVFAKLKDLGSFLSLDGKASRGEFWTTVLLLSLPLALLSGIFTVIALFCLKEPLSIPLGLFAALTSTCLAVANLAVFPVMVRRLHDAKVSGWLAVACFAVSAVPYYYLGYAGWIVILVVGILPPKADADGLPATGSAEKAKMWALAVLLSVLAAAMAGSMMDAFASKHLFENAFENVGKAFEKAGKEMEKEFEKSRSSFEKEMNSSWGTEFGGKMKRLSDEGAAAAPDEWDGPVKSYENRESRSSGGWGDKANVSDSDMVGRYEKHLRKMNKEAGGKLLSESDIRLTVEEFKKKPLAERRAILSRVEDWMSR